MAVVDIREFVKKFVDGSFGHGQKDLTGSNANLSGPFLKSFAFLAFFAVQITSNKV